jgi:hypothetical protein
MTFFLLLVFIENLIAEVHSKNRLRLYAFFLHVSHQVSNVIQSDINEGHLYFCTRVKFFDVMDCAKDGPTRVMRLVQGHICDAFVQLVIILTH